MERDRPDYSEAEINNFIQRRLKSNIPKWFKWELNAGTLLAILCTVVTASVLWGTAVNKIESLEKKYENQLIFNEKQNNTNERLIEAIHGLTVSMARLQQQYDDRQYYIPPSNGPRSNK